MRAYQRGSIWVAQVWVAGLWCDIPNTQATDALGALALGKARYTLH